MKISKYAKQLAAFVAVGALIVSCDKVDTPEPLGDDGQTVVKLVGGGDPGSRLVSVDFAPVPVTIVAADLRRDVPNTAEMNRTMNVTIKDDTAALRAYNPDLVYLPSSFYTIDPATPKVGGDGGTFNITLNPGELAKPIRITIPDATVMDVSTKYGLAFTITGADADGVISYARTIVVEIGAKNKYDGRYLLKGNHTRSPYTFPYEEEMDMVTTGANSVRFFFNAAGDWGHPIGTATGTSWYGPTMSPSIEFNPSTDLATNIYQTPPNTTPIFMHTTPTLISRYDENTKTIYAYFYYVTGAGQDFSNRGWIDTLTYIGPRP